MRTLSLLAQKGGAGKTTLAVHLALMAEAHKERVALIDTDPQRSAAGWWRARKLPTPFLAQCHPKHLAKAIEAAAKRGCTVCIVDTPPHAGQISYLIAEQVDFNLIPCRPSPFDLRAIGKTVDMIAHLNAPAGIVINAAPPNRGENEMPATLQARKVLARYNLPLAPIAIPERPAYSHPMQDGRAYIEHFPTGKPAKDIDQLWAWVRQQLGEGKAPGAARPAAARPMQKPATPAVPPVAAKPVVNSGAPARVRQTAAAAAIAPRNAAR